MALKYKVAAYAWAPQLRKAVKGTGKPPKRGKFAGKVKKCLRSHLPARIVRALAAEEAAGKQL